MGENRRHDSGQIPIGDEALTRLRESYGPEVGGDYVPVPDDAPTQPDLSATRCTRCDGTGKTVVHMGSGYYRGPVRCPRCNGSGIEPSHPCDSEDSEGA